MTATESITRAPGGAHLVGGVPLDRVEDVFRAAAASLGGHLRRIPDGEVGLRRMWIGCQLPVLALNAAFEMVPPGDDRYPWIPTVGLRSGVDVDTVDLGSLGYAGSATMSYDVFARLQREGVIPQRCRFQVSLPGPLEVVAGFVRTADQMAVESAYAGAMWQELEVISSAIPPDRLAVQWDTCVQVGMVDGWWPPPFERPLENVVDRMMRQADHVPTEAELGYHLCYGDYQHRHFVEPADLSTCVAMANAICASVSRPVNWVHMPVPIERDDEEYFEPLQDLKLQPGTELYLGLVHYRDGIEGATRRIAAARPFADRFGVATECGMARRSSERGGSQATLPDLLGTHAAVSAPISS